MEKVTQPEPNAVRVVYGLPDRMDRLAAFCNAVVLQVVEGFELFWDSLYAKRGQGWA